MLSPRYIARSVARLMTLSSDSQRDRAARTFDLLISIQILVAPVRRQTAPPSARFNVFVLMIERKQTATQSENENKKTEAQ